MHSAPIRTMLAAVLALALSAGAAMAFDGPDSVPYPVQAEKSADKPAAKPHAKKSPIAKSHVVKPVAKPTAKTEKPAPQSVASPKLAVLPPAKPDTNAAKTTNDVFTGIPRDERLKVQSALLWSGDYTGSINSDDPMLTAVKNFQKRKKYKITGTLTDAEVAELAAAARDHEEEFGWRVVADPATGIRIGLPAKMVPQAHEAAHGTRWSSRHGEVQVETFRYTDPGLKLSDLFDDEKKKNGRQVEYSKLSDDGFIVSGLQGLKKFSVRAQMRDGEVRGFTMLFDQAMEGIVAPVMVAMASAFSPFPQRSAPFAALAKPVEYGNGLVVSAQGHIVTDAHLVHGCHVLVAARLGDAERIAEDPDKGLALLRIYGPRKFEPASLAQDAAEKTRDLTLAGIPDPKDSGGLGKLAEIKARLIDGNAIELRQPVPMAGFSGAAALDQNGRLIGIAELRNAVLASIEPAAPPVRLVRVHAIRAFLDAHHVSEPPAMTADARDSIVRVICVRN